MLDSNEIQRQAQGELSISAWGCRAAPALPPLATCRQEKPVRCRAALSAGCARQEAPVALFFPGGFQGASLALSPDQGIASHR